MSRMLWFACTLPVLVACGGGGTPAADPSGEAPTPISDNPNAPQMHAEFGVLDEKEVRRTFERLWKSDMSGCQKKGNEFAAGQVIVKMRVGSDGNAKWVFLSESNLGDRTVEKCILDAVRGASWPVPEGGDDGLAEQQLPFAELADRPPVDWESDRVRDALAEAQGDLQECAAGKTFQATAIVNTDGSVASVGMFGPDENSEEAIDCLVAVIKGLKFPTTGSWPARVSFGLP